MLDMISFSYLVRYTRSQVNISNSMLLVKTNAIFDSMSSFEFLYVRQI